ncbi:MAG: hypothetical protein H7837_00350 [Magnetococcus sp. MYC-9]
MKHPPRWLYATLTLCLTGCSGNISLPWESNLLDPARIATREPLEIPPDLHKLPPTGTGKAADSRSKLPWTDPSLTQRPTGKEGSKASASSQSIHLPSQIPENKDDPSLSRTEQEKLPAWMEKDNKGSGTKGSR